MRVNAFASGGLIPAARRGAVEEGLIEIADWFTTFCGLAGVPADDPVAEKAGLPAVDGLDMWPLISGAAPTSPRPYILLGASDDSDKAGNTIITGVLRADGYKLLVGKIANAFWTGPIFPNASGWPTNSIDCGTEGCLFNVCEYERASRRGAPRRAPGSLLRSPPPPNAAVTDPTEHHDISKANPSVVKELQAILAAEGKTVFNPDRGTDDGLACTKAFNVHGGFWGPFLDT